MSAINVCPHCGYDSTTGRILKNSAKGVGVAIVAATIPPVGALLATAVAADAINNATKKTRTCPNCKEAYAV